MSSGQNALNPLYYPTEREIFWTVYTNFAMLISIAATNSYMISTKGRCIWTRGFFWSQMIGLFGICFDFLFYLTQMSNGSFVKQLPDISSLVVSARLLFWEIFASSSFLYTFFTAFRVLRRFQLYWEELDLSEAEESE